MPTLPLYTATHHPDAWHHVRAPGGYECWRLDADDEKQNLRLFAAVCDGCISSRAYLRRYMRYHRHPTRSAPPVPSDFPCIHISAHRDQDCLIDVHHHFEAKAFSYRPAHGVVLGENTMAIESEGAMKLHLKLPRIEGTISLSPRSNAMMSRPLLGGSPARHHWLLSAPLGDVQAEIRTGGEAIQLRGPGYRDHVWGTSPLAACASRWMRGRIILPQGGFAFFASSPAGADGALEICLLQIHADGIEQIPANRAVTEWTAGLPASLVAGDELRLENPRRLAEFDLTQLVQFDAIVRGTRATALCEIGTSRRR